MVGAEKEVKGCSGREQRNNGKMLEKLSEMMQQRRAASASAPLSTPKRNFYLNLNLDRLSTT
jgi:hypothetical protein